MIVCSCHAISDAQLRQAAREGLSHEEVEAKLQAGTDCGCCREAVAALLTSPAGPCRADACPGCPHRRAAA